MRSHVWHAGSPVSPRAAVGPSEYVSAITEDRLDSLLARLGASDKVARELVEIGEPALASLDRFAADPSQPTYVRQAASLVAHHIRDRALRAPPSPPDAAAGWGNPFPTDDERAAFFAEIERAGGHITRCDVGTLVVGLPDDRFGGQPCSRSTIAEVDRLGEDFGGERSDDPTRHISDRGQHELVFWWD